MMPVAQPHRGGFDRDRLPSWESYADAEGLPLAGRGRWRTTRCDLHGGSDSLRINVSVPPTHLSCRS